MDTKGNQSYNLEQELSKSNHITPHYPPPTLHLDPHFVSHTESKNISVFCMCGDPRWVRGEVQFSLSQSEKEQPCFGCCTEGLAVLLSFTLMSTFQQSVRFKQSLFLSVSLCRKHQRVRAVWSVSGRRWTNRSPGCSCTPPPSPFASTTNMERYSSHS